MFGHAGFTAAASSRSRRPRDPTVFRFLCRPAVAIISRATSPEASLPDF
jgi:hypothetical protein